MRARLLPLLVLALLPAVVAQDEAGESTEARLQRDQARVGQRLGSLRDKLERLAERYDEEGRTRNAALLREAMARFDEQQLLEVQRDVQRGLEQNSLSTVERQDQLAAGLEAVYAILRDRRDVEELSRQADLAREGLAQLSVLAENQRRLLASTRATTDTPADLLQQALQAALELARQLSEAEQAAQLGGEADRQLGESELAGELAREQRALAAEPAPGAATQTLLEQALALLRERLAQSDGPRGEGTLAPELLEAARSARDRAREAAQDAAVEMQDAREALAAAERGEAAPPPSSEAAREGQPPSEGASPSPDGRAPSGEPADPAAAGETGAEPAPSDATGITPEGARDGSGEQAPSSGTPSTGAPPRDGPPQGGPPQAGQGQPPPDEPAAVTEARERMERAAERLDEVEDELARSERSLSAARNRARAAAQAQAEQAAASGEQLDELAQRLEAVEPQAGPEMLDRTRALIEELTKMQAAVQAEQMAAASQRAGAARLSLDQLLEMLQQRMAGASDQPATAPGQEQLDALASQQAELERQAAELMSRLSELPDQGFQQPGERARQAMQGAQEALRRGDPQEGATREAEAAEQLEQAAEELSGESRRYERLRQEEVLFRLNEDLTALLGEQELLSTGTRELDEARGDEERLSRSQRRAAGRMAEQERDLATRSEAIRDALAKDGALAFEHALSQTRDDLQASADKLADEQTGWTVQMLQADVEQRLGDLLAVLEGERERRRQSLEESENEPAPPGGAAGQQGEEPLVPTVAELLLIQRLEQAALARLDAFTRSTAAAEGELDDGARDLLQRWAAEHQRVTELFAEKFREVAGSQAPEGEPDPQAPEPAPPEEQP